LPESRRHPDAHNRCRRALHRNLYMYAEHWFRNLAIRLMLCLATAVFISATAYVCAWLNYRDYHYLLQAGKEVDPETKQLTLWQFTSLADTKGIKLTCILAGILAFPLCLLRVDRAATNRLSLVMVLAVHCVTIAFAVLTAVVISFLHLPSGH
jgi:hypothetical protein